jgi:hypothetical protein
MGKQVATGEWDQHSEGGIYSGGCESVNMPSAARCSATAHFIGVRILLSRSVNGRRAPVPVLAPRDSDAGLDLCTHYTCDPPRGMWITRDPIGYAGGTCATASSRARGELFLPAKHPVSGRRKERHPRGAVTIGGRSRSANCRIDASSITMTLLPVTFDALFETRYENHAVVCWSR